eukprot:gene10751-10558_t
MEAEEMFPDGDFSLEVSSPGVDEPLNQMRQYKKNIGRKVAVTLTDDTEKQTLAARIGDLKKNNLLKKYADRIGDIINGEVYQIWKKEILLLDDEGNELIMPKSEQIPTDFFKKGETVRAVVKK